MMLWRQPAGGVEGTKEIRASVRHNPKAVKTVAENWEKLTTPRESSENSTLYGGKFELMI